MMYRWILCFCVLVAIGMPTRGQAADPARQDLMVLCYHGILSKVLPGDTMSVSQQQFVAQLEYLKVHDFTPVSVEDVLQAGMGGKKLPLKPVLLSFDDAYQSFYQVVFPLLQIYKYPAMLAVVGSWIDGNPPKDLTEPLMSWRQIKEVAQSGIVEVVSHSYNLHRSIQYNPAGNVGAVVSVLAYLEAEERYETEAEYRLKLDRDFQVQGQRFTEKIGQRPRAIVWPYGRYNRVGIEMAERHGFRMGFTLADGAASITHPQRMNRLLMSNLTMDSFIYELNQSRRRPYPIRAMQVDLDLIYDPKSFEQTDRNLGRLIDRLVALKVNTVYLQAFSDPTGTGNVSSVYFKNSVLPVKADIFSHAVHQMIIRGMFVYAWMPTLSFRFPDKAFAEQWRIREYKDGEIIPGTSWYERLTPFSPEVRSRVGDLYEAMAASAQIHGILFQDDAYLAEKEDHHPSALAAFSKHIEKTVKSKDIVADSQLADQWTAFKTRTLIEWTGTLAERVRKYRPEVLLARNLYANVLLKPHSEFWFAQSYDQFLVIYDQVVVMAYPQMENAGNPIAWLRDMTRKVAGYPQGPDKTVFKLQAFDWKEKQWVDSSQLLAEMRAVLASGGRHLAYYPDNFWLKKPQINIIQDEMSTQTIKDVTGYGN